jgi:ABC-type multidrug transport system fused ATPase/permease subunit
MLFPRTTSSLPHSSFETIRSFKFRIFEVGEEKEDPSTMTIDHEILKMSHSPQQKMPSFPATTLVVLLTWTTVALRTTLSFAPSRRPQWISSTSSSSHHFVNHVASVVDYGFLHPASSSVALFGKKDKRKGGGGGGGGGSGGDYKKQKRPQQIQEKQSVREARFDAATRQFMFTLTGLTKVLPDKSKTILKNINLSFYPGAKIGVIGLNGSGKLLFCLSTMYAIGHDSTPPFLTHILCFVFTIV